MRRADILPRVRILHISTRLILGGSQENTVLSCEGQARRGHEVHLAYGPIYGPEGSLFARASCFKASNGRAIAMHEIPDLCREISPGRDRRCLAQLRQLMDTIKPDIVHTHSSKAGILGRMAAWGRSHCGVVHTIHGPPFMPVEGSPLRRMKVRAINRLYTHAERYAARRCHVIVSVADAMTEQFLARGIGKPEQFVTVHSGMEVEGYLTPTSPAESRDEMRRRLGFSATDFVVGTVARLAEHKGHDDLLDACGPDLQANPSWRLLWVGDGWWRDRLLARVRLMGLEGRVVTTGLVPSEQVAAHIRAMDVLAHASYREGLPRTVPQALLCGVPVVAYDADGTREACLDMQTGRLVPLADRARLREAVRWMYDHPDDRARFAQAGREFCRVRFSAETMVDRLDEVYRTALDRAGGLRVNPSGGPAA